MEKYLKARLSNIFNSSIDNISIIKKIEGGLSNDTYLVAVKDCKYTFRIKNTINKSDEEKILYEMEKSNITSKLIYYNQDKGEKISEYIDGLSLDLEPSKYLNDVALLLHKIHDIKIDCNKFDLNLDNYEIIDYDYPLKYKILKDKYLEIKQNIIFNQTVLCHNDFMPSNLIMADKLYAIDFELAGLNDPFYDIASYGSFKNFNNSLLLLDIYLGREANKDEKKKLYLIRIFQTLKWFNVAIFKHIKKVGNIDYNKHALNMLDIAEELIKEYIKL